jgi:hypothetical protein
MWHFRDWRRNVSLEEEGTEGKRKHRVAKKAKEGCIQVFDIGCPVPHERLYSRRLLGQLAWKVWGNTIPHISTKKNKKSVGPVNRKLAD